MSSGCQVRLERAPANPGRLGRRDPAGSVWRRGCVRLYYTSIIQARFGCDGECCMAGCNGRFMQGCSKVPASAHSAYIGVYVFAPASRSDAPPASDPFTTGPPYRGSVARGLAAASQFALRAHPPRRLHIPRPTGRPRSGCPSRGARAHPATEIRSYRTESKESGAREKSEWKMTF